MKLLIASVLLVLSTTANALPCDGLENSVTPDVKAAWQIEFAKQLESAKVEYVRSFRAKDWYMIFVRPIEADDVYLFFHGDPTHTKHITLWGGLARMDEGPEIERWVLKEAPGIPKSLASCFVWRVVPRPH
jgi:hypothetical protein